MKATSSVRTKGFGARWSAGLVAVLAAALAGCGASASAGTDGPVAAGSSTVPAVSSPSTPAVSSPSAPAGSGPATSAPAGGSRTADTYPLTVRTHFGDVTVPTAPERVVALSATSADEVISLGAKPIAVAVNPADLPAGYPWMVTALDGIANASMISPSGELNLEAIAQTRPDLIVAQTWQIKDAARFAQLNAIAPTVTADSDAMNVDWDVRLRATAAALARGDEADAQIAAIEAEFAEVGKAVPDISTKTYQWVRADPDGFGFGNGSVLELFGLTPAANQDNTQNGPVLSKENTSQLDADLLGIWVPGAELRTTLDHDPLFQALPAVRNKTVLYADLATADAANSPAPMALRWVKEKLTPAVTALAAPTR